MHSCDVTSRKSESALTLTSERPNLSCRNTTSFSASKDDKKEEKEDEGSTDAGTADATTAALEAVRGSARALAFVGAFHSAEV